MTVPNITLEQIIATYPAETVETCREVLSRCNKAIDAYNESSMYQPLISSDEARKLENSGGEAQRKIIQDELDYYLTTDDEAFKVLQSLPMVSGEPVAYMFKNNEGTEIGGLTPLPSKRDLLEIGKQGATVIPLYTSPQPLKPITADDVTDEMLQDIFPKSFSGLNKDVTVHKRVKGDIANIYNAVIKNRSEA